MVMDLFPVASQTHADWKTDCARAHLIGHKLCVYTTDSVLLTGCWHVTLRGSSSWSKRVPDAVGGTLLEGTA